jgi:hypothetical protein
VVTHESSGPNRRFSTITTMPNLSAAASNAGFGGLCAHHHALTPMSFKVCTLKSCNASGTAVPSPPRSYGVHIMMPSIRAAQQDSISR